MDGLTWVSVSMTRNPCLIKPSFATYKLPLELFVRVTSTYVIGCTLAHTVLPFAPPVKGCQIDTFFRLGRRGTHNTIHSCEITEMLQATPQRFSPRIATGAAAHKAAELCNPAHRLAQRGWLRRRRGAGMDGTVEPPPFLDLPPRPTR